MARMSQTPVNFNMSTRPDSGSIRTSGRAGRVIPFMYAPVLRGDSASGSISAHIELGHMPKPLVNGVTVNAQVWFVPKLCHPQFNGSDDFLNSYQKTTIRALESPDREPPKFFQNIPGSSGLATIRESPLYTTLGIHMPQDIPVNTDIIDAYNLIYNFRLAAHSSNLPLEPYAKENLAGSTQLHRAFWPTGRYSRIVADYERALVLGSLQLDVAAGQLPVSGITGFGVGPDGDAQIQSDPSSKWITNAASTKTLAFAINNIGESNIFAEMAGQSVVTSLADIDKARATQGFAKLRTSMNGAQSTGYKSDDMLLAELMQGFSLPQEAWTQPILLDSSLVPVGFDERKATDGDSLEQSSTQGTTNINLSVNLPANPWGGMIMATVELLPERLNEASSDVWMHFTDPSELPDALRDSLRVEPTDVVPNHRIDSRHKAPNQAYGWERMNDHMSREDTTRFGGEYFQPDPGGKYTEARSAIWLADIVDPVYSTDHFLAPKNFPHDVFSDRDAPAFELVGRHSLQLAGLTQIGDPLVENDDSYEAMPKTDEGDKPETLPEIE